MSLAPEVSKQFKPGMGSRIEQARESAHSSMVDTFVTAADLAKDDLLLTTAAAATVYAASKTFQRFQMWREERKIMKEAQKEVPKDA